MTEALEKLGETYNFSQVTMQPPDQKWGALQSDGSWNGFVRNAKTLSIFRFGVSLFYRCNWSSVGAITATKFNTCPVGGQPIGLWSVLVLRDGGK
jgi:hypothetical protein